MSELEYGDKTVGKLLVRLDSQIGPCWIMRGSESCAILWGISIRKEWMTNE
ncbi:hypothetical protein [Cutibacterium sp.]|uniref:hypothetical protein n=1 Tax=Cutibacterium sp. TaxID=1912221 RepID=UPI0026DD421F|nr:hypothetical protein [Cutibacterium sp.]MDO4413167.1 hypothetical protein [Cutibacterium sp.]